MKQFIYVADDNEEEINLKFFHACDFFVIFGRVICEQKLFRLCIKDFDIQ